MWVNATSSDGITNLREIEIQTNVESQKQAKLQSRTTTKSKVKYHVCRKLLLCYGCKSPIPLVTSGEHDANFGGVTSTELVTPATLVTGSVTRDSVRDNGETRETTQWRAAEQFLDTPPPLPHY